MMERNAGRGKAKTKERTVRCPRKKGQKKRDKGNREREVEGSH